MHEFKVWAPRPKRVSVQVRGEVFAMAGPDERGFWQASVEAAGRERDYGFLLTDDTGEESGPWPDPRRSVAAEWGAWAVADLRPCGVCVEATGRGRGHR